MRAKLHQLVDRGVGFLLITGQRRVFSAKNIWNIFFGLDAAIFLIAVFGLVTFLFPVPSEFYIPWWTKLAAFSIFIAMVPSLYFLYTIFLALTFARVPRFYVFEPLVLLFVAVSMELADRLLFPFLFGDEWARWGLSESLGEQVAGTFIILLCLDIMFCYFVMPRLKHQGPAAGSRMTEQSDYRESALEPKFGSDQLTFADEGGDAIPVSDSGAEEVEAQQKASAVVEIDGYRTPKLSILGVEAEEHYVRVWTEDRELYARQSFGGLVAQMNDREGFSPRRGVWLNYRNIQSIRRDENGKYVIGSIKGPTVVVPKAKAREIRGLLEARPFLSAGQDVTLQSDVPCESDSGEASKV